ncbi:hypothetical protein IJD34_04065 [bacterium]|nr:hypothetical protein [bacterium]
MKISAIKTVIQKPARRLLPYAIGAMALVGCTHPTNKINDYCRRTDKTIKQYREYVNRNEDFSGYQAILDSLVYRDLLNNSELANDSSAIAEFNKISTSCRYGLDSSDKMKNFEKTLVESDIPTKDYQDIMKRKLPENRQFYADKYLFRKFFTEKGLMTKDFAKNFEHVSTFLKPSSLWSAGEIAHIVKPSND